MSLDPLSERKESRVFLELLRDEGELFHSTSPFLPCRCLNRSRSSPTVNAEKSSMSHIRRLSSPCSSLPCATTVTTTTDSGLNSSTGCTTSRSPTPDLHEQSSSMVFDIDSIFNRTLTQDTDSFRAKKKTSLQKSNRSLSTLSNPRSDRVKRVLKRYVTSLSLVQYTFDRCLDCNGAQ